MTESQPKRLLQTLGLLQVWGGGFGLFHMVAALDAGTLNVWSAPFAIILAFYGASLGAGLLLLRRGSDGLLPSLMVQAVQVLQVQGLGIVYSIVSGAQVMVALAAWDPTVSLEFGSTWRVGLESQSSTWIVGLNLLPVFWVLKLLRAERSYPRHARGCGAFRCS